MLSYIRTKGVRLLGEICTEIFSLMEFLSLNLQQYVFVQTNGNKTARLC